MAKSKREEAEEAGDYEFKLPAFDEPAFIRREVLSARASFVAVGLGILLGILAAASFFVLGFTATEVWVGMLLLIGGSLALPRLLAAMKFPEDLTTFKATFGSMFMVFFTGLSVWMLGVNL